MPDPTFRDLQVTLPYLARDDQYRTIKPFGADFPVDHLNEAQITNHVFDREPIRVYDLRGGQCLDLNVNGACWIKEKTSLRAEDASPARTPEMENYLKEVQELLLKHFSQYVRIEILDYVVRKRARGFPDHVGLAVEFEQPAALPHTDFSVAGAEMYLDAVFPSSSEEFKKGCYEQINVWRVLRGPNDDWPLAVCDFQTVDMENDVTTNDCIHRDRIGENRLIYPNQAHRWYYISAQEEDDFLVFRNVDSEGRLPFCFHGAFYNPSAKGEPRMSIDVRVLAFRS